VVGRLVRFVRGSEGFGLVELLIAMMMLNIGLLALLSAFVSGSTAVRHASRIATASTLADTQMELYRALTYPAIELDAASLASTDDTYRCDSALGSSCPNTITTCADSTCADGTVPVSPTACTDTQCLPAQDVTGPDHGSYRVDTYIAYRTPDAGRSVKVVTIVVRDASNLDHPALARESSSFDLSTGS
jgi:Tfp pilus assembly protein PilV